MTTAVAGVVVLAGCGTGTGGGEPGTAAGIPAGDPVAGGTLRWRASSDEGCIDPAQVQLRPFVAFGRQMVDSLTYQNNDGEIEPWLASEWTVNEDATAFTFTIRDGVTFGDGTPVTADIVKRNYDAISQMGVASPLGSPVLAGYTGSSVEGNTVTMSFGKPSASFLQGSSIPALGIVSQATLDRTLAERCAGQVDGTGPFEVQEYVRNSTITLARREGYAWPPASFDNQGNAYLDSISVQFVPDGSVAVGMILSDQIDFVTDIVVTDADRIVNSPGVTVWEAIQPGTNTGLATNPKSGPMADLRVRQAVNKAINREELVAATLSSIDTIAPGILSPKNPGFADLSEMLTMDVAGAGALLDQAGWIPGPDGVRIKDGQPLSIEIMYYVPPLAPYQPMLELIQQQLAEVGIEAELSPQTVAQAFDNERTFNFDLSLNGRTRCDPIVLADWFGGYDPELDTLMAAVEAEPDTARRNEIAAQAQRFAMENVYLVPTNVWRYPQAYRSEVQGVVFDCANVPAMSEVWMSE
ncbi:ABC transporter substrate-binding protein [Pseudonocardia sp. NPDC049635]|uniref:ABC transporter substrate-binding protein n=1 Tax=Pseudonocardia sp. NPDC049635 TaxID=3155506 RepID=UPI00340643B7